MFRLSRFADYSFILLRHMAQQGEGYVSAADLAAETVLPTPTTAKVLKELLKAEVITSRRGIAGGYKLERQPKNISVAEIITAIDGPIALTACVEDSEAQCHAEKICPMRGNWDMLNTAVRTALDSVSLADIIAGSKNHSWQHKIGEAAP